VPAAAKKGWRPLHYTVSTNIFKLTNIQGGFHLYDREGFGEGCPVGLPTVSEPKTRSLHKLLYVDYSFILQSCINMLVCSLNEGEMVELISPMNRDKFERLRSPTSGW
jgi:hypothetical protein